MRRGRGKTGKEEWQEEERKFDPELNILLPPPPPPGQAEQVSPLSSSSLLSTPLLELFSLFPFLRM